RERQTDGDGAFRVNGFLMENPAMAADDRSTGGPVRPPGDRGKVDVALRYAFHRDLASGNEFEVLRPAFEDFGGMILDLTLNLGCRAHDRGSSHIRHAARRCAPIVRRAVSVRAGDAHATGRYGKSLGADLAEPRVGPLADIARAGIEQDRSVLE